MRIEGDISLSPKDVGGKLNPKTIRIGGNLSLQSKTYYDGDYSVTPTEEVQTIPINGDTARNDITVGAIPSDYVGSAIITDPSITISGTTVTIPAGYYSEEQTVDVQPSGG